MKEYQKYLKIVEKQLKNELRTIKKEQGEKIDNVNTNNFNSYIECNVKVPQIMMKLVKKILI